MFIFNFKINGSKVFKIFFTFVVLLLIFIMLFVIFRVFSGANKVDYFEVKDSSENDVYEIKSNNYANILKNVHENINDYVGTKFKFSGYVYRVLDLDNDQFVLARDMIISSDYQSVVVGFLCSMEGSKQYNNGTWVEVTGEIEKGNYHGDMPILKIINITTIVPPSEEFVYPPDNSYIPTFSM